MVSSEEIVLGDLPAGIVRADEAVAGRVWNVLGHTYITKAESASTYSWLSLDPAGTGVPPHVHPTQDEFIYVFEGVYTLYLDGQWTTAGPGDLVQMPKGIPHAYYNKQDKAAKSLFWVSPGGKLANLFSLLHNVTDPAEVVRLSALNGVDFLPEGAVEGA
ncbi:cupin domain-containing protein [Pseudoclavibacter sp. RFBA6]|uniref:cupin domain-containing protein n=1 Tax=Pseudoclavibacter sp. RFBA6 TaxID=2080573 RepID=UPI000CE7878E|nr:cupin domain-containing protein [Pseudoclavibacter sp. RFBA6]PPG38172.1 cupin domain-containing protein [Pseudoclavibacter sp. RFBA6]